MKLSDGNSSRFPVTGGRKVPTNRVTGRTAFRLAAAVASLMLFTACSPGSSEPAVAVQDADASGDAAWKKTVTDAKTEGRVVLYLSITGVDDRLQTAWKAAYPEISLQIFRTGSAEILSRLDQEKSTGAEGADVTVMADAGWYADSKSRLMEPSGPAHLKYWEGSKFSHEKGKYVLVDAAPLGLAYNTNVIKQIGATPIKTYEDLLQPALKDYVAYTPADNASAALQWWHTVDKSLGGTEGLKKLKTLNPKPYKSLTPMVQALAAGEHAAAAYTSLAVAYDLQKQGAPIEVVVPSPAVGGGHFVAAVDWATHKSAAQVFRNWLLSPAGQIALNGPGDLYTPLALEELPNAPAGMKQIPEDMYVTDGTVTPEQQSWMKNVWNETFK
jgi:iron(III) transport system substrate-binding protein